MAIRLAFGVAVLAVTTTTSLLASRRAAGDGDGGDGDRGDGDAGDTPARRRDQRVDV